MHGQQMLPKMHGEVRTEELMDRLHQPSSQGKARAAGLRLVEIYSGLASRGEHLFAKLLAGQTPKQWAHYPMDDAVDTESGFQWFYHSHSKEDRPGATEHGHIHLFALRKLWARRLRSAAEIAFAKLCGDAPASENTRHLLTIGFDAKGVPTSLFTVNSWVTGDRMLSKRLSVELLNNIVLDTGNPEVDGVIESLVVLYRQEIADLCNCRDTALFQWDGSSTLSDERLELLSSKEIDVDSKLALVIPAL